MARFLLPAAWLVLFALAIDFTPVAADADGPFNIVDTRQGAIRYNARTGKSWLLVTDGVAPQWREIQEPTTSKPPTSITSFKQLINEVEWIPVFSADGKPQGLKVKSFTGTDSDHMGGLKVGDLLTLMNGTPIDSDATLRRVVRIGLEDKKGVLKCTIRRGDETVQLDIRIEKE